MGTVAPASVIIVSCPSFSATTSTLALSVSINNSNSLALTMSPDFLFQEEIVASVTYSPTEGIFTSSFTRRLLIFNSHQNLKNKKLFHKNYFVMEFNLKDSSISFCCSILCL